MPCEFCLIHTANKMTPSSAAAIPIATLASSDKVELVSGDVVVLGDVTAVVVGEVAVVVVSVTVVGVGKIAVVVVNVAVVGFGKVAVVVVRRFDEVLKVGVTTNGAAVGALVGTRGYSAFKAAPSPADRSLRCQKTFLQGCVFSSSTVSHWSRLS